MSETIARASGGSASTIASMAGNMNAETKRTGRMDLAPGFGTLNDLARGEAGIGATPTAGDYHTATRMAWNSADLGTLVRGKDATQTQDFANHFRDIMMDPGASPVHKRDAAVAFAEMQNSLPQATAGNQQVINDVMRQIGIDHTSGIPIDAQLQAIAGTLPGGAPVITASEIRGLARVYDSSTPSQALPGGAPGAGGPGAPPPPTPGAAP
jgi:hypothetical protein